MVRTTSAAARLGIAIALSACGPVASFTPRGDRHAERASDCALLVIHQRPEQEYRVIGVLDLEAFSVRRIPSDDVAFLELAGPVACRAGADAMIPGINGDGRYVQATAVKWIEPRSEPTCPPTEAPPRLPEPPVIASPCGGSGC